jgi:hypothetical protein
MSISVILNNYIFGNEWGRRGMHIGYWWESQKEGDHWGDQDVGGWTVLKWFLERCDGMEWFGRIWFRIGTIERSGSINCWEVLEGLHNWRLLEKVSAA